MRHSQGRHSVEIGERIEVGGGRCDGGEKIERARGWGEMSRPEDFRESEPNCSSDEEDLGCAVARELAD